MFVVVVGPGGTYDVDLSVDKDGNLLISANKQSELGAHLTVNPDQNTVTSKWFSTGP